jgi:hypothetical protein
MLAKLVEAGSEACAVVQQPCGTAFRLWFCRKLSDVPYRVQLLGFQDRVGLPLSVDFLRPSERDRAAILAIVCNDAAGG